MFVNISSSHLVVSEDLKHHIQDRLTHIIDKYLHSDVKSSVHFNKNNHYHTHCAIVIHEGIGKKYKSIKSDFESDEAYSAFDVALTKVAKQLRKYKSRLKNNYQHKKLSESLEVKKYIIDSKNFDDKVNSDELSGDNPAIIAEHDYEILTLSLSEAVMKMDLENVPALIFKNLSSGIINMIYRKNDGNIAWIPTISK